MAAIPCDMPSILAASSRETPAGFQSSALGVSVAALYSFDRPRNNQSATASRWRLVLVRMSSMDKKISVIEAIGQKFLVSFDNEPGWHHAIRVSNHPILGDNRKTFDLDRHAKWERMIVSV
jgi:hypothetical protein